jgi:hypothetical protein
VDLLLFSSPSISHTTLAYQVGREQWKDAMNGDREEEGEEEVESRPLSLLYKRDIL